MIVPHGKGYIVKSEKGKKMSKVLHSRQAAMKRLRQIEWFKHHPQK
jgi:hypothetical protein